MLILDRASENKLEELVLVSRKLNGVLRENYPGVHKIEPDRAALLWCAIDDEIAKRQGQIDKILNTKKWSRTDSTPESLQRVKERIRSVQPAHGRNL